MSDSYETAYRAASDYCREVKDSILASIRADLATFHDTEALDDRLYEEIDGCETVIYTGRAWCYLFASSNDGAAEDELGERDGRNLTVEQRCYFAIRADVQERIEWENMRDAVENRRVGEYLAMTAEEAHHA